MQQIFHEIKIKTQGQGLYNFTEQTLSWLKNQKTLHLLMSAMNLHFQIVISQMQSI